MRMQRQSGSSLVEVMVALFVLAIGLLGILAMQSKSMQFNQSAHVYSQAVYLANDIAERIRMNSAHALAYEGDETLYDGVQQNPSAACTDASCNAAALAAWDIIEWNNLVGRILPAGNAVIDIIEVVDVATGVTVPDHVKVEISFDDSRSEGSETATRKTYALVVGL